MKWENRIGGLIMLALILLICFRLANGADLILGWDKSARADYYEIVMCEMGIKDGEIAAISEQKVKIDNPETTEYKWENVPETGLILFKVRAINEHGIGEHTEYGAFFNPNWKIPYMVIGVHLKGKDCPADLNRDRVVDLADQTLLSTHFGRTNCVKGGDENCIKFDLDGDGNIGPGDMKILQDSMGEEDCDP